MKYNSLRFINFESFLIIYYKKKVNMQQNLTKIKNTMDKEK